ncbi:unnamed protein product [Blepharisma stoltei]|uniref:DUF8019 domain-containing protein n=1 Tax=Blepharisma stoltei TaxID=1481888 RepID=A0AAU9JHZ1_9CILI|nr:unnamed protein product [Blepharisma stoltei]
MENVKVLLFVLLGLIVSSSYLQDCLNIPFTLCMNKKSYAIADLNKINTLIGWWTFDDKFGHDYSHHINPLETVPMAGPGQKKGSSLYFDSTNQGVIPHISYYEISEFSVMFWIFLTKDSTGAWRTIFHKGQNSNELTPTVLLWPKERRLHARVSTDYNWNEGVDSTAIINMRKWAHISLVGSGQLLQLYINGYLDNQIILHGNIQYNRGDIFLGKDPWHMGFSGYFDDLRLYDAAIHEKDLLALAESASPMAAANGVMLGCQSCSYPDATSGCIDNYHICSLEELYSGSYEVARSMGWFKSSPDVWVHNTPENHSTKSEEMYDSDVFKLGLCCRDY